MGSGVQAGSSAWRKRIIGCGNQSTFRKDSRLLISATSTEPNPPLIAVYGPTGIGKTACAVHVGQLVGGEVVNADSRYLYRRLNIGVAKPTEAERGGVPHHLIDVFEPHEQITLATVQAIAYEVIAQIHQRANVPIVVGGTPLYMISIV